MFVSEKLRAHISIPPVKLRSRRKEESEMAKRKSWALIPNREQATETFPLFSSRLSFRSRTVGVFTAAVQSRVAVAGAARLVGGAVSWYVRVFVLFVSRKGRGVGEGSVRDE